MGRFKTGSVAEDGGGMNCFFVPVHGVETTDVL